MKQIKLVLLIPLYSPGIDSVSGMCKPIFPDETQGVACSGILGKSSQSHCSSPPTLLDVTREHVTPDTVGSPFETMRGNSIRMK